MSGIDLRAPARDARVRRQRIHRRWRSDRHIAVVATYRHASAVLGRHRPLRHPIQRIASRPPWHDALRCRWYHEAEHATIRYLMEVLA